jgi:hypothetical protein
MTNTIITQYGHSVPAVIYLEQLSGLYQTCIEQDDRSSIDVLSELATSAIKQFAAASPIEFDIWASSQL